MLYAFEKAEKVFVFCQDHPCEFQLFCDCRLLQSTWAAVSASHAASVLPIVAVSRTLRVTDDATLEPTGTALSTSGCAYICAHARERAHIRAVHVCNGQGARLGSYDGWARAQGSE